MSNLERRIAKHRAKPPGACIFCGGGSLSREHIWPQWASDLLPDASASNLSRWSKPVTWSGPPLRENDRNRQGGIKGHRIRVVCRSCNNGWMSQLEQQVRPTLTTLIAGGEAELCLDVQRALAEWFTLKMMVAEHDHPPDASMTSEERSAFFTRRSIPSGLQLWLFVCGERAWRSAYYRASFTLSRLPDVPNPLVKNVSCVTLGLGELLALGIYDGPGVLALNHKEEAGRKIWPGIDASVQWPPSLRLNHEQALSLAHTIETFAAHPDIYLFGAGSMDRLR